MINTPITKVHKRYYSHKNDAVNCVQRINGIQRMSLCLKNKYFKVLSANKTHRIYRVFY